MNHVSQVQPKIVVFDDDAAFLSSYVSALETKDFLVEAFTSPHGLTVEDIAKKKPDCISLDVMMPGMTGFQFAEQLQKNPTTKEIPFVFVTSRSDDDDRLRGEHLGCRAYFVKHTKPLAEIAESISSILKTN